MPVVVLHALGPQNANHAHNLFVTCRQPMLLFAFSYSIKKHLDKKGRTFVIMQQCFLSFMPILIA